MFASLFFAKQAQATHIIGAEIRYEYVGPGEVYEIILDVYRDCGPGNAGFDSPAYIHVFDDNFNFINSLTGTGTPFVSSSIIPNNISNDPCLLPPDSICVETAQYKQTMDITNVPGGLYFVYQRCCRNAGVANIIDPLETGSSYFVYLSPEARALSNNSPKFNESPPIYVCVGLEIEHDYSAFEPDGDSLVYRLYTPFIGADPASPDPNPGDATPPPYDPVTWIDPPYNLDAVLGPSPGGGELSIDSQTGLITGFPLLQGRFVVGVAVDEYRNGLLMSTIRRDFQYNVGECVDANANIDAPPAQCDDLTVTFENNTQGPPNYEWFFDWPNPTPTSNEAEPTYTYPSTGTYTAALIVAPGFDCVDTAFHEILLQDNSLIPDFSWQTYDCENESVLVLTDLSTDSVSPPVEWNWTIEYQSFVLTDTVQNPVILLPREIVGTITLNVISENGCNQTVTQSFFTGGNYPPDCLPDVTQICIGESAELNPDCDPTGFFYHWSFPIPVDEQSNPNPTVTPIINTTYLLDIYAFDSLCVIEDLEVTVEVSEDVILDFEEDTQCDVREVHFINQSVNADQGFEWNFGDPTSSNNTSTAVNPIHTYPDVGTYTVMLATAPDAICKDTIFRDITLVEKILEADFSFDYTNCEEDAVVVQFFDETINSEGNPLIYDWQFSGVFNGSSDQPNPIVMLDAEGDLTVSLTVTTDEDCVASTVPQTLNVDFTELPGLNDAEVLGCLNGGVTLNPGGDASYLYQWSPTTGLDCVDCPSPFANPNQTTTYTVLVTNISADTCEIIREVTVNVPTNVNLLAGNDVMTCDSFANLEATSILPVLDLTWCQNGAPIGSGASIEVPVSGYETYVIKANDQFDCPYFDTVQVVGGPADIATSGDEIICSDELENLFAINEDVEDDTLVWQWTPVDAFSGPTDVSDPDLIVTPGEQVVFVEATNQFGCTTEDSVLVAILDINNSLSFEHQVGCSGSTVSFTNTSTDAFNYFWDFGDPTTSADTSTLENPVYTYSENGTYTVTLTIGYDGLDCVTPFTDEVEITDPVFVPGFTLEYIECTEDSIFVQFIDTTLSFQPVDFWFWTSSDGDTSTLQNPQFWVSNDEDFIVTLVVGNTADCVDSISQSVKLDFPVIEMADTLVLCLGDSVEINPLANPTYEFLWFPNENISDPTADNPTVWPSETTTYSVQITTFDTDTCSLMREVVIFVPEKIEVTASDDTLTCGGEVTLLANSNVSPTTFTWTNMGGGTVGNGPVLEIYPFFDEIYEVLATDQYGCQDSTMVDVDNESIDAELDAPDTACPDIEITLDVGNNVADHNLSYDWSSNPTGLVLPPANTASVQVQTMAAGGMANYSVIVTNQFDCADTLSQNIEFYTFESAVDTSVFACPGVPTELNPSANPDLTYVWTPGDSLFTPTSPNPTVTTSIPMVFSVTVSDVFGMDECSETFTVNLDVAPPIEFVITPDTFTCGEPIDIVATTSVATDLTWFDSNGNAVGTGNTISVNPDSVEIYTVIAEDMTECFDSASVTVWNRQLDLLIDGQGVIDTCPSPSYDLCVENLDPTDILTYQWLGDTIISGENAPCVEVTTAIGESIFLVNVENQFGCEIIDTFNITTFDFDPIIREVISICPNVPTEINPGAAGSDLMYSWTPEIGLNCYDCPNPEATLDSSMAYMVTVMGAFGADTCTLAGTVQVIVMPEIELEAEADPDATICELIDVTLTATVESDIVEGYSWSTNPDLSAPFSTEQQIVVSPTGAITYYVSATDTLGCMDTAEVTINAFPLAITYEDSLDFCEEIGELEISLFNGAPVQELDIVWSPEEFIIDIQNNGETILVDISESTLFTASVSNQFGCVEEYEIWVEYYNIGITIGEILSSEDTIYFNSGEFSQLEIDFVDTYQYEWFPEDGLDDPFIHNPIATPEETTTYTVTVIDEGGCVAEREVTIVVLNPECDEPNLFLPNAFSPNGDGENDILYFRSNIVDEMELSIYNRWGQLVFRSTDQNNGWDGTYENDQLPPDVFGYYLRARCFNGMEFFKKGNVTILR